MEEEKTYTEREAHRHFAGSTNGEVWNLLEKADRTPEEDELMVHAAHASCYHWLQAGTAVHHQRGEWLNSRVYSELGYGKIALCYARRCQALTEEHADEMEDFDVAYAYEAVARAHAACGNEGEAVRYLHRAQKAGDSISDEENKKYFIGDLGAGDWHGLR